MRFYILLIVKLQVATIRLYKQTEVKCLSRNWNYRNNERKNTFNETDYNLLLRFDAKHYNSFGHSPWIVLKIATVHMESLISLFALNFIIYWEYKKIHRETNT